MTIQTEAPAQAARDADLKRLMMEYQQANGDALAELVRRLTPALMRFFQGPYETRSYTEDLLQEFWLRVHKSRHTYRPESPVLPWIYTIARYTRVDMFRRFRYRQALSTSQVELNEEAVICKRSGQSVLDSRLDSDRLLARLPENQREVMVLTKLRGLSIAETARAIGTTAGAVKQRVFRAQRNLRSMVSQMRDKAAAMAEMA